VCSSVTGVNSSQLDSQHQQVQSSMPFGRRRSNSLPKNPTASRVASPESVTNPMAPSNVNSPSTGTAPIPSSVTKTERSVVAFDQNKHLQSTSRLMSAIQRHGLASRKRKKEDFPEVKNQIGGCLQMLLPVKQIMKANKISKDNEV